MANKNLNARIVLKHDTEENWLKAQNFIPLTGEIVIYDADENNTKPRMKVGNGTDAVNALPFIGDEIATEDEVFEAMSLIDMLPIVTDSDGAILTDENNNILLI